jgi:hypothetical protein
MTRLRQGDRGSALWGSGTRGGDSRGSALWGKGGRRAGATLISAALAASDDPFVITVPATASLVNERPTAVVAPGHIQLSGTSFATPIVSGVAAPNPNAGLDQFVKADPTTDSLAFDSASCNSAALANASWNSVSWNSASWNSASWNSVSWNSASWNSASQDPDVTPTNSSWLTVPATTTTLATTP